MSVEIVKRMEEVTRDMGNLDEMIQINARSGPTDLWREFVAEALSHIALSVQKISASVALAHTEIVRLKVRLRGLGL